MKKKLLLLFLTLLLACSICLVFSACGGGECKHRDADDNSLCDKCGEEYTDGIDVEGHTHTYDKQNTDSKYLASAANCENAATYYYSCTCGEMGSETFAHGSVGEHNVDESGYCTECDTPFESTQGITYEISEDGTYAIVTGYSGTSTKINIADTYENLPVKKIASGAFEEGIKGCRITTVTIPDSVITIGSSAFSSCDSLTSVTIGDSIAEIGYRAFFGCTSLICNEYDNAYYLGNDNNPYVVFVKAKSTDITYCTIHNDTKIICDNAFEDCTSLTSVTIGDSVTSIGDYAFDDCYKLVEVINKSSLEIVAGEYTYGEVAYYAKEVHNGESKIVNKDGYLFYTYDGVNYLFGYTGDETALTLPDSYNGENYEIYKYAFYDCDNLISITIPDSVTEIGACAFEYCTSLTSVTIGDSVTSIGSFAFYDCYSLTSVTIPDSVTKIGLYAFSGCTSLASVTIGDGVASIGGSAFSGCTSLASVTIGDGVASIGGSAFNGCSSLTSVTIGDSVTSIGRDAFADCYKIVEIINQSSLDIVAGSDTHGKVAYHTKEVHNGESKIVNKDGYLFYTYDGVNYLLGYVGNETALVLPNDYNGENYEFYKYAFYNCDSLTSVTISYGITTIVEDAFSGCDNLTKVIIPDSVTEIGDYAFQNCTSLTSVIIPDSVTSIGFCAFVDCTSLTSVTIGDSVASIGERAFNGCSSLTSVTIGDGVASIGNDAFTGCTSLTSVIIPDSVTKIGLYAFSGCTSLASAAIGDGVTYISWWMFSGCTNLTSVTIGDSVTKIGPYAFQNCISLISVTIPTSVTDIDSHAFDGCYRLVEVISDSSLSVVTRWEGTVAYGTKSHSGESRIVNKDGYFFYISNGINYLVCYTGNETDLVLPDNYNGEDYTINRSAFSSCINLTSVTIPDSVTIIGDYAFSNCDSLTSVTIPDSVTSIGDYTFENCTNLTSVTIGDSIAEIGYRAFFGCTSLIYNEYDNAYYLGNENNPYVVLVKAKSTDITSCTIHNDTKIIYYDAFEYCNKLVEIINKSALDIVAGDDTHGYVACYAKEVHNGESKIVDKDGYLFYTYDGVNYLLGYTGNETALTLPDSYNGENYEIYYYAFYENTSLASVTIPDSVTSIGEKAFRGCTSLTSIKYRGTEEEWNAIDKGSSWDYNTGSYTITYNYEGE